MPADAPTILATSGGLRHGRRTEVEFGPLVLHAIELSGATGRPRLCHIGTAGGDQRSFQASLSAAGDAQGIAVSHLSLFYMPSTDDMTALLLEQDVVWVGGGSVANLLALWRLHGLDQSLRQAWRAGVVLAGVSAGSVCWHIGGTTDSFGPDLPGLPERPVQPVQPPHRQQVGHAAAADPDHVLAQQQTRGIRGARHGEQVQVRHGYPRRLARLAEQGVEPLLVPAGGADVADPRGAPLDAGQLERVLDQRSELEGGARSPAQSARGRQDGGPVGWHPPNVPNPPRRRGGDQRCA